MKNAARFLLPVLLFATAAASAQSTYQWDTNGATAGLGGTGTWDTTGLRWDEVGTGVDDGTDATVAYTFLTGDTARFGGTAGTVTLGVGTMAPNILVQTGSYTFNVGGNAGHTFNGEITIAPTGITRFQAGNNSSRTFNGEIKLNGGTLKFTGGNNVINPNGGISGTGTVDYETSTRMIFGNNSYSGSTLLAGTETDIRHANAFGTSTVTITGGGINARVAGVTLANNAMNWNGSFSYTGTNALNLGTGAITLGADVTVTTTANTLTVGGAISDGGNNFGLTKAGSGTLIIEGATSYTGDTTINAGTLSLGDGVNPTNLDDDSSVKINGLGVLELYSPGTDTVAKLFIDGIQHPAGTWGASGSGATNQTAAISGPGILNVTSAPDPILVIANSVTETTNSAATSLSIPVSNNGATQTLSITAINLGGADAASFAINSSLPLNLAPAGGAANINYTFTPTSGPGPYTATFEVISNDTTQSPKIVTLVVTDNPDPWLQVASPVNLTNNGAPANYSIPVSNIGNSQTLNITSITAGGADAATVSGLTSSLSIPASGGDSLNFTFTPDSGPGPYSFTFTLDSNMPGSPSQVVNVSMVVQDPVIALSGNLLNFGVLAHSPGPQTLSLQVSNQGGAEDLLISGTPVTGASEFAVTSAPTTIAPGATGTIEVTFTPGTGGGRFSGSLAVESNDFFGNKPTVRLEAFVDPAGTVVARFDFDPNQTTGATLDLDGSTGLNWTTSGLIDVSTNLGRGFYDVLTGRCAVFGTGREADAQTPVAGSGNSSWTTFTVTPQASGGVIDFTGGTAVVDTYAFSGLGGTTSANWTLYYSTNGGTTWTALGAAQQGAALVGGGSAGPVALSWDLTPIGSRSGPVDFILDPSTIGYGTNGSLGQRSIGFDNLVITAGSVTPGGGTGFASWAAGFGIPNDPAYDGSDNDGIPALVEYALGLSPLTANGSVGTFNGNTLAFTKGAEAVANGDVSYAIETSQLLTAGSWSTVTPTLNNSTTISFTLPTGQGKLFGRLVVTQN